MKEMIVAVGINNEIGKDNKLLWRQREDMKHFTKKTKGKNVVMGRKTFESLPNPLKGRKNYVLSNSIKMSYYENGTYVEYLTYENFINKVNDYIVIGGSEVFESFENEIDILHLTSILAHFPEADVYFHEFDTSKFEKKEIALHSNDEYNEYFSIMHELKRLS